MRALQHFKLPKIISAIFSRASDKFTIMNKNLLFTTILFIAISIFAITLLAQEKNEGEQNEQAQIILFYGDDCSYCIIVEEYIEENSIEEKMSFERKEVRHNKNNADDLVNKAKTCELSANSIGVPFLWDGSRCFVGDRKIIEFLEQYNNEK